MTEIDAISSYHAHVYYDPAATRDVAERVRQRIAASFPVRMGNWHDNPVGPHVRAMYQVAFEPALFADLVPWLMLNREGLTVLVHPNTDRPRDDHLLYPLWMGEVLPIKEEVLREARPDREKVEPNSAPRTP